MVRQSHSHHQQLFYLKVEEPIWQSMKCKLSFNQEVIRQVSLCILIIIQSLALVLLGYTAGFTSVSAPAIFTTPLGITSTLTVNVGPYSNTLNTLGLTLAVVALT